MPLALGTTTIKDVKLGNTQVLQIARGGTIIWTATVEVTLANATQVNVQNLFSSADWSSPKIKRVVIPSGVTIGSSSTGTPAMRTGTGWGGQLVVENHGSIQGAGGAANSGVGGDAFQAQAAGVQLINTGTIYAGGGGGGKGGTGGGGVFYNGREPSSGWRYSNDASPFFLWVTNGGIAWNSYPGNIFNIYSGSLGTSTSRLVGNRRYLRGPHVSGAHYQVARDTQNLTNGGAGGNGGRGQGYGQSRANGSAGAAGGTNAGAGGTGGGGGNWGVAGTKGNNGGNGNRTNGAAGANGGLAGFAIVNPANVILTDTGTILGR